MLYVKKLPESFAKYTKPVPGKDGCYVGNSDGCPIGDAFDHLDLKELFYQFDWEWPEFQGDVTSRLKALRQRCDQGLMFSEYGSFDSLEQFFETDTFKTLNASPERFVVVFDYLDKKTHGGYRFHKNGPYLGTKSTYEHLGDCNDMDGIFTFHAYRERL